MHIDEIYQSLTFEALVSTFPTILLLIFLAYFLAIGMNLYLSRYLFQQKKKIHEHFCYACKRPLPFLYFFPLFKRKCYCGASNLSSFNSHFWLTFLTLLVAFFTQESPQLFFFAAISICLILISTVDIYTLEIPLSALIVMVLLIIAETTISGNWKFAGFGMLVGAGYLGFVSLLTTFMKGRQTMGFGDMLLIAPLGLWLGAISIFLTIFVAALVGMVTFTILRLRKIDIKNRPVPFGPMLASAAWVVKLMQMDFATVMQLLG